MPRKKDRKTPRPQELWRRTDAFERARTSASEEEGGPDITINFRGGRPDVTVNLAGPVAVERGPWCAWPFAWLPDGPDVVAVCMFAWGILGWYHRY